MFSTLVLDRDELSTWIQTNKMIHMNEFFDHFCEIYDKAILPAAKCKNIGEYTQLEEKLLGLEGFSDISESGTIPVHLNKLEMTVLGPLSYVLIFLTKWAGCYVRDLIERLLTNKKEAEMKYEPMKMKNAEILENFENLMKKVADSDLTNGLLIADLENRIRNLEADVIAKE
ncbi:hypothetical protein RhiirA5_439695 [Rhizophagus irregularis]|uniref:Uncharacterized protein n=1 Tax=Rhizophagus irregularis TaxID=588596 RepID=A0A2N0NHI2_9GLOM|nr:hypothetical protein RhiirA5_439695 [Rhizophagus irregularis]